MEPVYTKPRKFCKIRLTPVMPIQQHAPMAIGLPPFLTSLTMLVFSPIAAIAMMMKNLLSSLMGAKKEAGSPKWMAVVVMMDAPIKNRMKNGKTCFSATFFSLSSFLVRRNASRRVMGMMAKVLVSFTVTALSKVADPRFHMLSQVAAVAVTEEVSFTAVPAKIPKASPEPVSKPISCPKAGKSRAAKTLKKKMTEIA